MLKDKLVGFGCDGASVMLGRKVGVATLFTTVVHCIAHRLELAFKDAIKQDKPYETANVLLLGLYYFYRNSPKQREKFIFSCLNIKVLIPTRVGGTSWVGHILRATDNFLKGFQAIRNQIEDCLNQKAKVQT